MGCRFVEPMIDRLLLSLNDWIDVKRDLNVGEQRAMFADMRRRFAPGEMPILDPAQVGVARILAYVIAWSFTDAHGQPVRVSAGAVDSLCPDTFEEMREALDRHVEARERAHADEKKTRDTAPISDRGLQSVS